MCNLRADLKSLLIGETAIKIDYVKVDFAGLKNCTVFQLSRCRIWKKHLSRTMTVSVHIDVLEAIDQPWSYSNTAAIEDCVYTEIDIETPTKRTEMTSKT